MSRIVLHGLGQAPSSWDGVLARLDGGADCPSLPELVRGKRPTYDDLYGAVRARCDDAGESPHLCGLSLGAVLALNYAIERPVKSLVLIAPQYRMPRALLAAQSVMFRLMPASAFAETGFDRDGMLALTGSMRALRLEEGLEKIACPTLVIVGGRDRANARAARGAAERIPGARLRVIENAGHEVNVDAPRALADVLRAFWQGD